MKSQIAKLLVAAMLLFISWPTDADEYDDTVAIFKNAGESGSFFAKSYGYAVFPTVGKGGFVVGAARGNGRVFEQGKYVGDATTSQISVGAQAGGQAYSQIVFFQDKRAFDEFTSGNFEFGATAQAVVITAGASASAGSTGTAAGASGGKKDAKTVGEFHKGMAVFTVPKGGLMYEASIAGQKFKYTAR